MAEYMIQDATLTGIGDKIRAATGTTGAMSPAAMQSDLDTFNTDMGAVLSEQDGLIAQIAAALEGKMVPKAKKTVSITVTTDNVYVFYFDADGLPQRLYDESATIEALGGIVTINQNCTITVTGSYMRLDATDFNFYCFASDGGTMTVSDGYSGQ